MYNQPGASDIMIAFQVPNDPALLHVTSFNDALIADEGGCKTPFDSKQLSEPHSVAMVDLDGDCMTDLFVTINSGGR